MVETGLRDFLWKENHKMAEIPAPEERFHSVVIDMTQLIYELVDEANQKGYQIVKPSVVSTCGSFLNGYDKVKLIQTFIEYSHINWDQINENNEEFFVNNAKHIFRDLPMGGSNHVDTFKLLFTKVDEKDKQVINKEDRKMLWSYFEAMVRICINYIHENRKPSIQVSENGERKPVYRAHFFKDIKIHEHAKKWDVPLEFARTAAAA